MIICDKHGAQGCSFVSPDIQDHIISSKKLEDLTIIHFEYLHEVTNTYFLSKDFSIKYKLKAHSILPLPDNYPEWATLCEPVCFECFNSSLTQDLLSMVEKERKRVIDFDNGLEVS